MKARNYIKEWNKVLVPSGKFDTGFHIGIILPPPPNYEGEIYEDGITFNQAGSRRIRCFNCERTIISHYRLDAIRKFNKKKSL